MNNIQSILLDIGGTLYNCKSFDKQFPMQIERTLARKLGLTMEEASTKLSQRMAELSKIEGDPSKVRAMATFGITREEVHEVFCQVEPSDFLSPAPAIADLLLKLKNKSYRLAILSNFRKVLVDKILEALGLRKDLFMFFITEDDGLPIKPAVEPFLECIRRFDVEAGNIAYVGDNLLKDMVPANSVGMQTIWIAPAKRGEPLPECVHYRIDNVLQLSQILELDQ